MRTMKTLIIGLAVLLVLTSPNWAQFEEEGLGIKIKSSLNYQYVNLTINWDDEEFTSKLKSHLIGLTTQFEISEGINLNVLIGYAFSDFKGLIFRQIPFSVDLSSGGTQGFLIGAGADASLFYYKDIEIGARGQFVYYLGSEKEWDIPGLSASGTVTGKPSWYRLAVGPIMTYRGFDYFFPYASLGFHYIGGTFKMQQAVQTLTGSEDKDIKGAGYMYIDMGARYEITSRVAMTTEFNLYPNNRNLDYGFTLGVSYVF